MTLSRTVRLRWMAMGVACLWLLPLAAGLATAASGKAAESCCRSKKTCCCRTSYGKSGWKSTVQSQKCARTCAGAFLRGGPSWSSAAAAVALEVPAAAERMPAVRPRASRSAVLQTRLGRAPPPLV